MDRNLRFQELEKRLALFGLKCRQGKGSEVIVKGNGKIHVIGHHGKNYEVPKQVIASLRRKFGLKAENGVPDAEFYGDKSPKAEPTEPPKSAAPSEPGRT